MDVKDSLNAYVSLNSLLFNLEEMAAPLSTDHFDQLEENVWCAALKGVNLATRRRAASEIWKSISANTARMSSRPSILTELVWLTTWTSTAPASLLKAATIRRCGMAWQVPDGFLHLHADQAQ